MKRTTLIIAAAAILLIGVVAIAMNQGSPEEPQNGTQNAGTPPPRSTDRSSDGSFKPETGPKLSSREERERSDEDLVERYGESRTELARHVSGNVVGLLDDVISMGEMMVEGRAGNFGGGGMRWVTRGMDLELSEEQEEQAKALMKDYRQRELEKTKAAVANLKDDPTPLMGMLLAGDARSREEMSEEDYAALQQSNADELGDIINPLDRSNFRGGSPLSDDEFRASFEAILDEGQAASFQENMAERAEDNGDRAPRQTNITQLPVMDLEKADQAIESTRQMTAGFKQVVEGMGNLGPLMEQQRRDRDGGDE